jgi:hypothetical protein
MRTVTLTETDARDFLAGSDGAYYTPVVGVEARCRWCGRWGHPAGLYLRQVRPVAPRSSPRWPAPRRRPSRRTRTPAAARSPGP